MKKKKIVDENMPIGELRVVKDFLPSPAELILAEETQKITLLLDRRSVEFFKARAKKHGTKYQRMMREVLKRYATHHSSAHPA